MLEAFLSTLEEHVDFVWAAIVGTARTGDELELRIDVVLDEPASKESWRITASDLAAATITTECALPIALCRQHPMLAEYHEVHCGLYFRGVPGSVGNSIASLRDAHLSFYGKRVTFERFLNRPLQLREALAVGHGQIATGPRSLMETYKSSLLSLGVEAYLVGGHGPLQPDASVLLLGESYVIAGQFRATRCEA